MPVATLETKILCQTHNEALSEIDAEAIRIFKFIGDALTTAQNWQKEPPAKKPLFPNRYYADGKLFERWCAKTLIDFMCVEKSDTIWHDTRTPIMEPPIDVVRAIYGISCFTRPLGLYLAQESTDTQQEVLREALTVDPRFHPESGGSMGGFIGFRDYRFLTWLSTEPFDLFTTEVRNGASGLRVGELLGLKWEDVDFERNLIHIKRSIVKQRIGPPKTEASQKPIPLNTELAKSLRLWKMKTNYNRPDDWVYASPTMNGTQPYWPNSIFRVYIKPAAKKIGLTKRIGWHTFRHTFGTILNANGENPKVIQELLRHATLKVTMDTYVQAMSDEKRKAQSKVVEMIMPGIRKKAGR
ncbi:MAG TPA: site-specific integrase [Pyrinomonadaceae bacterium]|nr:site-specific integrase [Pyrinomonadaceae bacterium]